MINADLIYGKMKQKKMNVSYEIACVHEAALLGA